MTGFLAAFGVVFLAELGDKSQLLVLSLAARFSPWSVLAGLATVSATLMIVSVAVGASLATAVPEYALQVVAGVAFLGFAVWTWLDDDEDEDEVAAAPDVDGSDGGSPSRRSGFATTVTALGVAELGDKTMLAAVGLAASYDAVPVWAGASLGMVASSSIAVVVGTALGRRLPEGRIRVLSAALFAVFGVALIVTGLV